MSGAFDLTPMLTKSGSNLSLQRSPEREPRQSTRFSTEATPATVLNAIETILNKMSVIFKVIEEGCKVIVKYKHYNLFSKRFKYQAQHLMD